MKIWIITAVDTGDTCDGKARVLAAVRTREEAVAFVEEDIRQWADDRAGESVEVDFDKMCAHYDYDSNDGCEWNIEEVEVD